MTRIEEQEPSLLEKSDAIVEDPRIIDALERFREKTCTTIRNEFHCPRELSPLPRGGVSMGKVRPDYLALEGGHSVLRRTGSDPSRSFLPTPDVSVA
mmetsp:Transcript_10529/g.21216  ORF Transcript_10529/g.21216 Transcript_10529/m.21216 type:complete len:97 (+) Transcript_10529:1295-1585(+)